MRHGWEMQSVWETDYRAKFTQKLRSDGHSLLLKNSISMQKCVTVISRVLPRSSRDAATMTSVCPVSSSTSTIQKHEFKMYSKGINSLLLCGSDFWLDSWAPSLNDTWKWSIFGAEHLWGPEIYEVLLLCPSPSLTENHWQTGFPVPALGHVTQL